MNKSLYDRCFGVSFFQYARSTENHFTAYSVYVLDKTVQKNNIIRCAAQQNINKIRINPR
jgi:hypothetical protein